MQGKLDNWGHDLDLWKEVVEKIINVEVKTSLQLPLGIKKIDVKYSKGYRYTKKDEFSYDQ